VNRHAVLVTHPETKRPRASSTGSPAGHAWAKDRKVAWKFINARSETVRTTAAFKAAYKKRRCLLPVDGFFEWKKVGKEKRPYLIGMADGEPFTLAALWENWKDPETSAWVRTFTILTTEANELVATLHDRMPVILAADDRELWLTDKDPADLMRPYRLTS
jgi:putative SOS response-associated peptidase YedK